MADPFDPPVGRSWTRVSSRLAKMRRTELSAIGLLVVGGVASGVSVAEPAAGIAIAIAGVIALFWGWFAIGRNMRSWGYAEREDDLLVVHGAMFKRLTVVPYGRMQLVDVKAGPVERVFGLVNVKLHTAAATTDATVRGLLPSEAEALRDRLTALGEAHAAGL